MIDYKNRHLRADKPMLRSAKILEERNGTVSRKAVKPPISLGGRIAGGGGFHLLQFYNLRCSYSTLFLVDPRCDYFSSIISFPVQLDS